MSDIAISAEGLGKQYCIGGPQQRSKDLRETLSDVFVAPFRRARNLLLGQPYGAAELDKIFWALKEVSFEVKKGEVLGIIGHNGAGKTTLLKILSRITDPTEGHAQIHGRLGSLLEVGTGFHPELTGRENIFLSGSILGLKRKEIAAKFDEIVAFAELEKFIDTPVKRYSSGMYVRLGFAIAAHIDPDILIVDEVLSVGDLHFQKKCFEWVQQFLKSHKTFLLVSHQLNQIENVCQRVFFIKEGDLVFDGPPDKAISLFLSNGEVQDRDSRILKRHSSKQKVGDLEVEAVELFSTGDNPTKTVTQGSPLTVRILVRIPTKIIRPKIEIAFKCGGITLGQANTLSDGFSPDHLEGEKIVTFHWPRCFLSPNQYSLDVYISDGSSGADLFVWQRALDFRVVSPEGFCLATGDPGFIKIPGKWTFGSK